jgi:iron complex outermembrane receptor protein
MKHHHTTATRIVPALLAAACSMPVMAQESATSKTGAATASNVFTLGQITVSAARDNESPIGTATLDREQLWDFSKDGLAEALNLIPGVATTTGAGTRNEALISVRGFDRWQVPLLMDGIRLYLPADNRIDFDRFLTPDLSEIQVSKGYVSVLNGPDGMGGAINLVTRKPIKPFEGEVRASVALGEGGQYNGNTVYANLGGRREGFYYQVSAEQRDVDSWRVSKDFRPTVAENGGDRDHTSKKDWRGNLKAGLTPNATDEYSLNYVQQAGQKHGIGAVTGTSSISTWD